MPSDGYPIALNLRVDGSIPSRLTTFFEQISVFEVLANVVQRIRLRLGCRWLHWGRVIETIHRAAIRPRYQVSVGVDGDLNAAVAQLLLYVNHAFTLLEEQRRKGMPEVVDADMT